MPAPATLGLFAVASVILVVSPGPAVVYIVGEGIGGGRRAGIFAAFGIFAGGLIHVTAAALGLSALLAASTSAFTVLKLAGAGYLIFTGLRTLLSGDHGDRSEVEPRSRTDWQRFRRGFIVQVLNPKAAVFFVAFLPQFIDPGGSSSQVQATFLGVVFVLIALASDTAYGFLAGSAGKALASSTRFRRIQRWVSGLTLVGLGAAAAVIGRNP